MKYDKKRFEGLTADEKKALLLKDIMLMLSQDPLYNGAKISLTFINVKIPNQKKVVTNGTELFTKIYKGITTYYKNEPFYQALFLFGFSGRRC